MKHMKRSIAGALILAMALLAEGAFAEPVSRDVPLTASDEGNADFVGVRFGDIEGMMRLGEFMNSLPFGMKFFSGLPELAGVDLLSVGVATAGLGGGEMLEGMESMLLYAEPKSSDFIEEIKKDPSRASAVASAFGMSGAGITVTEDGKKFAAVLGPLSADALIETMGVLRSLANDGWKNYAVGAFGSVRTAENVPVVVKTDFGVSPDGKTLSGKLDSNALRMANNVDFGKFPVLGMGTPIFQAKVSHIFEHLKAFKTERHDPMPVIDDFLKTMEVSGLPRATALHLSELVGLDVGWGDESEGMLANMRFPSVTLTFWNVAQEHRDAVAKMLLSGRTAAFKEKTDGVPKPFDRLYVLDAPALTLWAGFIGDRFILSFSNPAGIEKHFRSVSDENYGLGGTDGLPYTVGLAMYPSNLSAFARAFLARPEAALIRSQAAARGQDADRAFLALASPIVSSIDNVKGLFTAPGTVRWSITQSGASAGAESAN